MKTKGLYVLLVSTLLFSGFALAQPTGAGTTTSNANQTATTSSSQSVVIDGGNTTKVKVTSDSNTDKWAGFYGNISAQKVLGDGTNNFFSWTTNTFSNAQVVIVPTGDPAPSSIAPVTDPNGFLGSGFNSGTASANKTFTLDKDVRLSGDYANGTAAVNTYNANGNADESFTTYLTENGDAAGEPVYIAEGSESTGFRGNAINYQLMAGVGESSGPRKFDFYLEVD